MARGRVARTGLPREELQHRQREASSLASPGLCRGEQIAPGKHHWNSLRLDGGRLGVTLLADCA
jgi:hypothetical protein